MPTDDFTQTEPIEAGNIIAERRPGAPEPPIAASAAKPPVPTDPEELAALRNLEERRKRASKKRVMKIAIVCGIAAVLVGGWAISGILGAQAPVEDVKADLATVTRGEMSSSVQATGALKPGAHVAVTPEVSGVIQEVMVAEGQQVQEGDVLLTLKNSELDRTVSDAAAARDRAQRAVDNANAGVADAQNAYNEAVGDYNKTVDQVNKAASKAPEVADKEYKKVYEAAVAAIPKDATESERKKLLAEAREAAQAAYEAAYAAAAPEGLAPFEHSGYLSAIEAAQESAVSADEALQDAQRDYEYALEEADKRAVRAPASGTVLDLQAVPGAAVGGATGGTSTASGTLMEIADLSTLGIDIEVNEVDIAGVAPGQQAKVTFTAIPDLEMTGSVASVASVATGSSGGGNEGGVGGGVVTFKVTTVLDGTDPRLKPGMSASVSIMTKDVGDALVIPAAALIEDGGKTYVFVVTDEQTMDGDMREVVVADRSGGQAAIQSGLEEGEVVLAGSSGGMAGLEESASASGSSASAR